MIIFKEELERLTENSKMIRKAAKKSSSTNDQAEVWEEKSAMNMFCLTKICKQAEQPFENSLSTQCYISYQDYPWLKIKLNIR